jgi:hypothetical protein
MSTEFPSAQHFELTPEQKLAHARYEYARNLDILGGVDGTDFNPTQFNLYLNAAKRLVIAEKSLGKEHEIVSPELLEKSDLNDELNGRYYLASWLLDEIYTRGVNIESGRRKLLNVNMYPDKEALSLNNNLAKDQREITALSHSYEKIFQRVGALLHDLK